MKLIVEYLKYEKKQIIQHCRKNYEIKLQNSREKNNDIANAQIHKCSLSWLVTDTSIKVVLLN